MHSSTVKYLNHLQEFVNENREYWMKTYRNTVGVSIANRTRRNEKMRTYAIVFHVTKKDSGKTGSIPPYFEVKLPGRKTERFPTDVVETGCFQLTRSAKHITPGCTVRNTVSKQWGTLGAVMKSKATGEVMVLGNMHVLGSDLLGKNRFDASAGSRRSTLEIVTKGGVNIPAHFIAGKLGGPFDFALAVPETKHGATLLPCLAENISQRGFTRINSSRFIGWTAFTLSRKPEENSRKMKASIRSWSASVRFALLGRAVTLTDLIQLDGVYGNKGDSGSPLFGRHGELFGILVGKDDRFSYAAKISHAVDKYGAVPV